MTSALTRSGLVGSLAAFATASACCVLPMSLMIAGLGGSWMAVFAPLAAASPYVVGLSVILLIAAWFVSLRRGASGRTIAMMAFGTALTAIAWLLIINEERLTMFFLSYM